MKENKKKLKSLVKERNFEEIVRLCNQNIRNFTYLKQLLYDKDEEVGWKAVEAVAHVLRDWWRQGKEDQVRQVIRNFFWSMTDESGGIGWLSAPAVAETVYLIPEIQDPYASMMIHYALEEPPLVKYGLWGIGRLGERIKKEVAFFEKEIFEIFEKGDSELMGYLVWALGQVKYSSACDPVKELTNSKIENFNVKIYWEGEFKRFSLYELVDNFQKHLC